MRSGSRTDGSSDANTIKAVGRSSECAACRHAAVESGRDLIGDELVSFW